MTKNSSPLNASMFQNYKESILNIVRSDQAFYFMNSIKGSPAYWKKFKLVLDIIKQLSCPSFFLTLSCADLHWEKIPKIIAAANGHSFSGNELKTLKYFEKCKLLNSNPFLLARHFQHRVSMFLKKFY